MTGDRLEVSVRDKGCGFDLGKSRQKGGLGIRSMEERVRSLGGKFESIRNLERGQLLRLGCRSNLNQESRRARVLAGNLYNDVVPGLLRSKDLYRVAITARSP